MWKNAEVASRWHHLHTLYSTYLLDYKKLYTYSHHFTGFSTIPTPLSRQSLLVWIPDCFHWPVPLLLLGNVFSYYHCGQSSPDHRFGHWLYVAGVASSQQLANSNVNIVMWTHFWGCIYTWSTTEENATSSNVHILHMLFPYWHVILAKH